MHCHNSTCCSQCSAVIILFLASGPGVARCQLLFSDILILLDCDFLMCVLQRKKALNFEQIRTHVSDQTSFIMGNCKCAEFLAAFLRVDQISSSVCFSC